MLNMRRDKMEQLKNDSATFIVITICVCAVCFCKCTKQRNRNIYTYSVVVNYYHICNLILSTVEYDTEQKTRRLVSVKILIRLFIIIMMMMMMLIAIVYLNFIQCTVDNNSISIYCICPHAFSIHMKCIYATCNHTVFSSCDGIENVFLIRLLSLSFYLSVLLFFSLNTSFSFEVSSIWHRCDKMHIIVFYWCISIYTLSHILYQILN